MDDPDNELGLRRFLDARERAAVGALPAERQGALAYALLSAGALLHLLEDAGEPAHVRNDFRSFWSQVGESAFERSSPYAHRVALIYGRAGVPAPSGPPVARPSLRDYFVAADGQGLAQRTQRDFFSPGSLPRPVVVAGLGSPAAVAAAANATLPFPAPRLRTLDLGAAARGGGYLGTSRVPYLLSYRLAPSGRLEFGLDERTHAAYARVLLGEVAAYAAGALEHLFRGRLAFQLAPAQGAAASAHDAPAAAVVNLGPALGEGRLTVLFEDARGRRRPVLTRTLAATRVGAALGRVTVPRGAVRLVAVFSGHDGAGEPIVVVEDAALPLR